MTKKQARKKIELLRALETLHSFHHAEVAHDVADKLLLQYIADAEIEEAWRKVPKWYA